MSTYIPLGDRLDSIRYLLEGKGIPYNAVKATSGDSNAPKMKHVNYLTNMTFEPNVPISNLVKHLMGRADNGETPTRFKALIVVHHLIMYGSERFIQNLSTSAYHHVSFDRLRYYISYDRSNSYLAIFIRRYSRYLEDKIHTYRNQGIDLCRIRPTNNRKQQIAKNKQKKPHEHYYYVAENREPDSATSSHYVCQDDPNELDSNLALKVRTMTPEQVLKILPIIQRQFNLLLAYDASIDDLKNALIKSAFTMLYKDFVKIYIVYQGAINRLMEVYFSTNSYKKAEEILEFYKKFLISMAKVSDLLPVVERVGLDMSDLPHLSRTPDFSLETLMKHLDSLSKKSLIKVEQSSEASSINRARPTDLARIEYGTLGKPRRRSERGPSSCVTRQTKVDFLSPMAANNYKRQQQEELMRLNKMLELYTEKREESGEEKTICASSRCNKNGFESEKDKDFQEGQKSEEKEAPPQTSDAISSKSEKDQTAEKGPDSDNYCLFYEHLVFECGLTNQEHSIEMKGGERLPLTVNST